MSEPFIGEIIGFGGNFAPRNWATCSGQLVAIQQNSALFSILGTTFGGNGTTTFGLPDLRGRTALGSGPGPGLTPRVLGEMSGSENVTLTVNEMPMHGHALNATSAAATGSLATGNILAKANGTDSVGGDSIVQIYGPAPVNTTMSPTSIGTAGGNQAHQNMQPYLVITYLVCMFGVFPSRN